MFRFSSIALLGCLGLAGCDQDKGDTAEEEALVLPQAGDWTIVTTGFTNDDCNAEGFLIPPDLITFADVGADSFSITYYLDNERIGDGSSSCTHAGENSFDCEDMNHTTMFSDSATITMVGGGSVNVTSETEASGAGNLVLDCTGMGCGQVEAMTNTGSIPCDTTINWTATVE